MSGMLEGKKDFWRVLAALIFPPLGVFLQVGLGGVFWVNLILTLLFYVPGSIHALWVIATTGPDGRKAGPEGPKDFWRLVVASFFPPLGVFLQVGLGGAFWVNLILTLLFYLPGSIHAIWIITTRR